LAPVPYFINAGDAFNFIKASGISQGKIDIIQQFQTAYQENSGREFYTVAFLMNIENLPEDFAAVYYYLSGVELNTEAYRYAGQYLPQ
jgi:hypothetical protein